MRPSALAWYSASSARRIRLDRSDGCDPNAIPTLAPTFFQYLPHWLEPVTHSGIVLGTLVACFALAAWGYDPQRGFGGLTKRGGGS